MSSPPIRTVKFLGLPRGMLGLESITKTSGQSSLGKGGRGAKRHYTRTEDIAVDAGYLIITCAGCGATKQRSGTKHNEFHQVSGQDLCNGCARKVGRQASGIEARQPRTPGRPKLLDVPTMVTFIALHS